VSGDVAHDDNRSRCHDDRTRRDHHNPRAHHDLEAVKAVVLVGGEGTRLRPLTYATPKALLPIGNQAFLERQLTWLAEHGVTDAILSLGYLPDAFEVKFPDAQFGGVALHYAVEDAPLGTAGAIRYATQGIDERVVVCNGDVLTTLDLGALVRFHETRGAEATIALTEVSDPSAFGVVPTRQDGEVIAFVEKPPKGHAPSTWVNAGTYVLEPSVFDRIPERLAVSIERETFPRMLENRSRLFAMSSSAYWIDIGTPEKYLQAHHDVLCGALGRVPVPDAHELARGVWVQGTADIDEEALLEPPVLVGNGSVVSAGARVVGSTIGAGVVVGAGARLLRSVVHDDAIIGDDAAAIDSVVGAGAVLQPGAIASDHTMMAAGSEIAAGIRLSGVKIPHDGADAGEG
jgi:mannose-1-phosphate guanylyltransferase